MFIVPRAEDMERWGERLAALLRPGDVVCLTGELGAGKTTLTRGIGRGLRVQGTVSSPSFVVARTHHLDDSDTPFVHIDAYRLNNQAELEDLDIDWPGSIVVIEWGHGMVDSIVDSWLELVLDRSSHNDDDVRTITVHAVGARGNELADALGRGQS